VRLGFETMNAKMMHDAYEKMDIFFYRRTCQSNCKHHKGHYFIL